jgi:hypothetical protein
VGRRKIPEYIKKHLELLEGFGEDLTRKGRDAVKNWIIAILEVGLMVFAIGCIFGVVPAVIMWIW